MHEFVLTPPRPFDAGYSVDWHYQEMTRALKEGLPPSLQLGFAGYWINHFSAGFDYALSPEVTLRRIAMAGFAVLAVRAFVKLWPALRHGAKWLDLEGIGPFYDLRNGQLFRVRRFNPPERKVIDETPREHRFESAWYSADDRRNEFLKSLAILTVMCGGVLLVPFGYWLVCGVTVPHWSGFAFAEALIERYQLIVLFQLVMLWRWGIPAFATFCIQGLDFAAYAADAQYIPAAKVHDPESALATLETLDDDPGQDSATTLPVGAILERLKNRG